MESGIVAVSSEAMGTLTKYSLDWITKRLEIVKQKKDIQVQQIAYEEIINSLLEERLEIQREAQHYMELYRSVTITDEDIEYLHNTLLLVLDIFVKLNDDSSHVLVLRPMISLLNKDLLKSMQLIGFSYKEAIGKPLTELCASKIRSLGNTKPGVSPPKRSNK